MSSNIPLPLVPKLRRERIPRLAVARVAAVVAWLLVCSSLAVRPAHADAPPAKRTFFVELFAAGRGITANYDHRLLPWLSLRGGIGYSFPTNISDDTYGEIVVSVHGLAALVGPHHLEASLGLCALDEIGGDRTTSIASILGGYRYQRSTGGVFVRVQLGLGVFRGTGNDSHAAPVLGIALGWTLSDLVQ